MSLDRLQKGSSIASLTGGSMDLGDRILVLGPSAAGKTTYAKQLGNVLSLPVVHMDTILWKPGWQYVGDKEACEQMVKLAQDERWIIEGYTLKCTPALLARATGVIVLDYPKWTVAIRYFMRWLKHRRQPRPELPGCPEHFNAAFLTVYDGEMARIHEYLGPNEKVPVIRIKSPGLAIKTLLSLSHGRTVQTYPRVNK